jgi:hypothetical protein
MKQMPRINANNATNKLFALIRGIRNPFANSH